MIYTFPLIRMSSWIPPMGASVGGIFLSVGWFPMNRPLVVVAVICAILAAVVIFVQTVRLSRMTAENERLRSENGALVDSLESERQENARLREIVERSNRALEATVRYLERSANENTKRIDAIDDADSDWLQCPLPDEVRDAFSDYCDAGGQTAGNSAGAVPEARGGAS